MGRKLIWTPIAKDIVRKSWGRKSPREIQALVIAYRKKRRGIGGYHVPTVGGVLYQALDMGLITEEEHDRLKRENKRKPLSQKIREKIFKRDGRRCARCGSRSKLEIDHVKPVMFGGDNSPDNLQILCRDCNKEKGVS